MPPAKLGGASVVRILEPALELGREALECTRLLGDRARKTARYRVDQNHRGQVAIRENVRPDRNRVRGEMLDNALVEALEARREQRELLFLGQFLNDVLGQLATLRRERDDTMARDAAVDRVQRTRDDVDSQDHPGPAAVRFVVDLRGTERRAVAVGEQAQIELASEHGCNRLLLRQPGESMRNEREDVELQGRATQVS